MAIFRRYTGVEGQSHIEKQSLVSHPEWASPQATDPIVFRAFPAGTLIDHRTTEQMTYHG